VARQDVSAILPVETAHLDPADSAPATRWSLSTLAVCAR